MGQIISDYNKDPSLLTMTNLKNGHYDGPVEMIYFLPLISAQTHLTIKFFFISWTHIFVRFEEIECQYF